MGLDMNLYRINKQMTGYKNCNIEDIKINKPEVYKIIKPFIKIVSIGTNYSYETLLDSIGYWRKANAIHEWFVDCVQDGNDEITEIGFCIVPYDIPPESIITEHISNSSDILTPLEYAINFGYTPKEILNCNKGFQDGGLKLFDIAESYNDKQEYTYEEMIETIQKLNAKYI